MPDTDSVEWLGSKIGAVLAERVAELDLDAAGKLIAAVGESMWDGEAIEDDGAGTPGKLGSGVEGWLFVEIVGKPDAEAVIKMLETWSVDDSNMGNMGELKAGMIPLLDNETVEADDGMV